MLSSIKLRNRQVHRGSIGSPHRHSRRVPSASTPVREARFLSNSSMRTARLSRRNNLAQQAPRRVSFGGTVHFVAPQRGDAASEQTASIANKQVKLQQTVNSGVTWQVNHGNVLTVMKFQSEKHRRGHSHSTLKRLLFDVGDHVASGKKEQHLQAAINEVYRAQMNWAFYSDGKVPMRPVPEATFHRYVVKLRGVMNQYRTKHPNASAAAWKQHALYWINNMPLPAEYYQFSEYYEYEN